MCATSVLCSVAPFQLRSVLAPEKQRDRGSDGGKPGFFQNPGSGSNPGFERKNPGFSGSDCLQVVSTLVAKISRAYITRTY